MMLKEEGRSFHLLKLEDDLKDLDWIKYGVEESILTMM